VLSFVIWLPLALRTLPFCCLFNADARVLIWSFDIGARRVTQWQWDDHDETLVSVIRANFDTGTATSECNYLFFQTLSAASIRRGSQTNFRLICVPTWPVLACTGILPAVFGVPLLRRAAQRWKMPTGHCATCGYDLRATPDRCPECGAVPNAKDARLPKPGG
jgi:hypothetical protein